MPPLPVIPDVFRVTFNWAANVGITPVNVIHVETASTDVQDIGTAILDAFDGLNCFYCCSTSQIVESLSILPLDGTTATINVPTDGQAIQGAHTGEIAPAVAGLVSFRTGVRGARGRGRMYIGPCAEAGIENGRLDPDTQAPMQADWITAVANLLTGTPVVRLGVASYTHEDWNQVISTTVESLVATQRRRQDQLRV